jgi:hypothetical protein
MLKGKLSELSILSRERGSAQLDVNYIFDDKRRVSKRLLTIASYMPLAPPLVSHSINRY